MKNILLVGIGGFMGSVARYLIGVYSIKYFSNALIGTFTVNLAGSFLIGLLAGFLAKPHYQPYQLILITGFCGGFTTFSTFSMEGLKLLRGSFHLQYIGYTAASIAGGLTLCFLGVWVAQKFTQ